MKMMISEFKWSSSSNLVKLLLLQGPYTYSTPSPKNGLEYSYNPHTEKYPKTPPITYSYFENPYTPASYTGSFTPFHMEDLQLILIGHHDFPRVLVQAPPGWLKMHPMHQWWHPMQSWLIRYPCHKST